MVLAYRRIASGQGHEAGRQLLAQLYRETFGKPLPPVLTQPQGKPYLSDGSAHFSISHTKGHVFCVLSDKPVGIDAEEQDRDIDLRLAEKILSPGEKTRFLAAVNPRQALLRLWVLKEAGVKCTGQGLRGYPNKTDYTPNDPRIREIDGCFVAVIEEI